MMVFQCDINTCKKTLQPQEVKKAQLMDKVYDLCEECFNSFTEFIGKRLDGGVPYFPITITQGSGSTRIGSAPYVQNPNVQIIPYLSTPVPYDPNITWGGTTTLGVSGRITGSSSDGNTGGINCGVSGVQGDYVPLTTDSLGRLWVENTSPASDNPSYLRAVNTGLSQELDTFRIGSNG